MWGSGVERRVCGASDLPYDSAVLPRTRDGRSEK